MQAYNKGRFLRFAPRRPVLLVLGGQGGIGHSGFFKKLPRVPVMARPGSPCLFPLEAGPRVGCGFAMAFRVRV